MKLPINYRNSGLRILTAGTIALLIGAAESISAGADTAGDSAPAVSQAEAAIKPAPQKASDEIAPEVRERLSPEQLYQLEMARIQARTPGRQKSSHSDNGPVGTFVPDLVPIAAFMMVIGMMLIGAWSKAKRRQTVHETARMMLEKGQPLPDDFFREPFRKVEGTRDPRNGNLHAGIIWGAVGLGIIALGLSGRFHLIGFGFVPLFVGIGYFVIWKISNSNSDGNPKAN